MKFHVAGLICAAHFILFPCVVAAAEIAIENPGFETDENGDGIPDWWRRISPAMIHHLDLSPPQVRTGSGAVEVGRFGVAKMLPIVPGEYLAFRAFARGDEGQELAMIALRYDLDDETSSRAERSRRVETSEWLPLVDSAQVPENAVSGRLELGVQGYEWAWYDDVTLYSEWLRNPSLEAVVNGGSISLPFWDVRGGSLLMGEGVVDPGSVGVSSDVAIAQSAAVSSDYEYLWSVHARGESGGERLDFSVTWLDADGTSMRNDEHTAIVGAGWETVSFSSIAPRSNVSHYSSPVVTITATTPSATETVWIDHIYMDRILPVSDRITPNGDGVFDVAEILVRLNEDTNLEAVIRDATGSTVAVIEPGSFFPAGAYSFVWEPPPEIVPATYELRCVFQDGAGPARILDRPISIVSEAPMVGFPPIDQEHFIAGCYAGGYPAGMTYPEMAERLVEALAGLGGTTAILGTHTEHRETLLNLADGLGVDIVLTMQIAYGTMVNSAGEKGFDFVEFRELLEPRVDMVKGYPSLLGYYTLDEPPLHLLARLFKMNSLFYRLDPTRPSLNTLNTLSLGEIKLTALDSPVYLYDDYPCTRNTALGDLGDFPDHVGAAAELARGHGVPLWMALQAFAGGTMRFPSPAEMRCMAFLSLGQGADGIVYFFLGNGRASPERPNGRPTYGIVASDFSPGSVYEDVEEVYRLIGRLGDLFLELKNVPVVTTVEPPGFSALQEDSSGNPYLWVINTDCLEPRRITTDLVSVYGSGYDVLANRPLEWSNGGQRVEVDLPPGGAVLIRLGVLPPVPPIPSDDLLPAMGSDETYAYKLAPDAEPGFGDSFASMDSRDGLVYLHTQSAYLEIWDVRSATPERLSRIRAGRAGSRVRTDGNLLALSSWVTGLVVVDVSDPGNAFVTDEFMGHNGNAENTDIVGDTLYVAAHNYGVYILDASVPTDPQIVNRFPTVGLALDIRVRDGLAYIADGIAGLTISDVTDPLNPVILSNIRIPGDDARQIILRDDICYVIGKPATVAAVDVSDPENPVLLHTENTFYAERASVNSNTLVVADRVAGLALLDVTVPGFPRLTARARVQGFPVDVIYEGDRLYVLDHEDKFAAYTLEEPFPVGGPGLLMLR